MNRSESARETTTEVTMAGYRRTLVTSIDGMATAFLVGTGDRRPSKPTAV
jgi:hypothetical protein